MKNTTELIGHYGSDEIIACSAWTSTSRDLTPEKKERVGKLIDMLWKEGHHTPFEKATVHFLVNSDIASHIHLLKHRISSLNAESARYKELKDDKYYIPDDWGDTHTKKYFQFGSDVLVTKMEKWSTILEDFTDLGNDFYHDCLKDLTPVMGRKRAKESARYFKTYNSQIQADVMFNMRSFANFLKLRYSSHAQKEIRDIAEQMWLAVKDLPEFKFTVEAIEKYTLGE